MKKTIALMLAMLFAVCAFATTAFADPETDATQATEATQATQATEENDDPDDGFNNTTQAPTEAPTAAPTEAPTAAPTDAPTAAPTSTTAADVTATLAPGETAYEGQGSETSTTKKPAAVDTTIPSTGSGIVIPAIALAVLAAGTVAVIKTKKED